MSSQTAGSSVKMIWIGLAVVVVAIASFAAGYMTSSATIGETKGFSVVDDYGRTVSLDGVPKRIVSVAPSPTEILFAIGAGPQIVGLDEYSDYPAETEGITHVGNYTLNEEIIVALQPDLIVSSDLVPRSQLESLKEQGIPYVLFADRTLEDVFKTIRLAGVITGHVEEADQVATALSERVDAVTNKTLANGVAKPKVYIEYDDYMGYWTYGPGSFGDDLIALAGGENVAHNTSSEYPSVQSEFVIAQNPDIIIYTTGPWSMLSKDTYINRSGWDNIDAVKNDKIYGMDANLLSRYGPRIVDCLEELAEIVHPELFT